MLIPQPRSFLNLLLTSFMFATIPLLAAVGYSAVYMGKLANQSQQAVYQAARATKASRSLVDQVTRLERAGRQFQILGDKTIMEAYQKTHGEFGDTASSLLEFSLDEAMRKNLDKLIIIENLIFTALQRNPYNSVKVEQSISQYSKLSALANQVLESSNQLIDQEVQVLHDIAAKARNRTVWAGLALIPAVIVIVISFSIILSRPIRQIDFAIRTLGSGEFEIPVEVSGPQDLQYLGQRLDWLRHRLAEVEQEKAKFVRHVSHELKTPLTAIREGAELLDDGVVGKLNQQQKQVVEILVSNTSKLQQLIEDLLNFSVARQKQATLNRETVYLDKLIQQVINDQKLAIISKKIRLQTKLIPVAVTGDREMLRVIVDNLLSNAVKFSPPKGRLAIAIRQQGFDVKIDIIDDGPGIKDSEKKRVFDAFFQGEAKAQGHIKDTGLGLSIVKEFIQAHGGSVTVLDNVPSGAHMALRLPVNSLSQEAPIVDEDRLQVF